MITMHTCDHVKGMHFSLYQCAAHSIKEMIDNINWYPGHMKKTRELIQENLKAVDLVIEIVDSRIPVSSRNPIIDEIISGKPRIIVLGKADLADAAETETWEEKLSHGKGVRRVMALNLQSGENIKKLLKALEAEQKKRNEERPIRRPLRIMIVGVPNVGKSSLINRLTGKRSAQTGDKPGVTKGKQWLSLSNGMQLLDTPGILWPKFEDETVGRHLAFIGSINDDILNKVELSCELIDFIKTEYQGILTERYQIEEDKDTSDILSDIAKKRGCLQKGNELDYEKAAAIILDEFRNGVLGRMSVERPV